MPHFAAAKCPLFFSAQRLTLRRFVRRANLLGNNAAFGSAKENVAFPNGGFGGMFCRDGNEENFGLHIDVANNLEKRIFPQIDS